MEGPETGREAAARRRTELEQRIQELHRRNHELTDILTKGRGGDRRGASSPDQVARAEELALLASKRADESIQRATEMYLHSATAHERAARMHSLLAEQGIGNVTEHQERAEEHIRLAAEDRTAAGRIAGAQQIHNQDDSQH